MSESRRTIPPSHLLLALLTAGFAGCASPREPSLANTRPLTEVRWMLTEILGRQVVTPADERLPDLRFDQGSSRVGGYTGCNELTGTYSLIGDRLEFPTPPATTRRACEDPAAAQQEADLVEAMERTRRFSLVGDVLTFYDAVRAVARFRMSGDLDTGANAP